MSDQNIAATLSQRAASDPHREAVACPSGRDARGRPLYAHLSYRQLDDLSSQLARGLLAYGFRPGMRTAFMVKPSIDFFVLTFALFKARTIPVLIDPGIGVASIKRCLAESRTEAFVGIAAAHAARALFRWRGAGWTKLLSTHRAGFFGRLWQKARGIISYDDVLAAGARPDAPSLSPADANDLAAVLFTSGSTGAPKGAAYSHGNFRAQIELLQKSLAIEVGERDLCTFPLFALFAPALGMSAVVPEMDFTRPGSVDPERIKEAIETFGVTNMFGSPALIKRVATYGLARGWTFPSLKRVISAGAPVPAAVIEKFRQLLSPACTFYTPYGATEALPVAIAESRMILGETCLATQNGRGVCVGFPVAGVDVKVIRIRDEAVSHLAAEDMLGSDEIGEIIVSGPHVTERYEAREEATRLAKIASKDGFYHRMGDLGYFDAAGRLWFCGRKTQRVPTAAGDLYTINCEGVFNQHPLVARTALVGLGSSAEKTPALCVEPVRSDLSSAEVDALLQDLRALARRHVHTQGIQVFFMHDQFPVDIRHNAKIFREKLQAWAEQQWRKKSSSPAVAASLARP